MSVTLDDLAARAYLRYLCKRYPGVTWVRVGGPEDALDDARAGQPVNPLPRGRDTGRASSSALSGLNDGEWRTPSRPQAGQRTPSAAPGSPSLSPPLCPNCKTEADPDFYCSGCGRTLPLPTGRTP